MARYWNVVCLGIQNTLVYRTNFLLRSIFNLIPLIATILLWRNVFTSKSEVAGYSLAQMITYYVIVVVVESLTAVTEDEWQIAADIKDGNLSAFLIKPLDYIYYRLSLFFAGRLIFTVAAFVPVMLLVAINWQHIQAPPGIGSIIGFIMAIVMSALIQFLLSFMVATLAFWVLEISTFSFVLLAFERIASGQMFPLDLLPAGIQAFVLHTPFAYQMYFPVSIYMGKIAGWSMIQGLFIQACWVAALFFVARMVWRRGLVAYEAVGG